MLMLMCAQLRDYQIITSYAKAPLAKAGILAANVRPRATKNTQSAAHNP